MVNEETILIYGGSIIAIVFIIFCGIACYYYRRTTKKTKSINGRRVNSSQRRIKLKAKSKAQPVPSHSLSCITNTEHDDVCITYEAEHVNVIDSDGDTAIAIRRVAPDSDIHLYGEAQIHYKEDEDLEDEQDENNNNFDKCRKETKLKKKKNDCVSNPGKISMVLPKPIIPKHHRLGYHKRGKRKYLKVYTMEEISEHDTNESCWIVVNDLVLNVTKFMKYHPAGINSILNKGGTVCDTDFEFHSKEAKKLFWKFVIGRVEGSHSDNCIIQ